jgi:hypothetical protein
MVAIKSVNFNHNPNAETDVARNALRNPATWSTRLLASVHLPWIGEEPRGLAVRLGDHVGVQPWF